MGEMARAARDQLRALRSLPLTLPELPGLGPSPRRAAVLILFGVLDRTPSVSSAAAVPADLDVLLQRRAETLSAHPGQIAFPGGRWEPGDRDAAATALREAREETGLDPAGVEVLGTMPAVPLAVSNHMVSPVLGWWRDPSTVAAVHRSETVEVFRAPVADLLDPANRFTGVHRVGAMEFRGPSFDLHGRIVWGFTAILLARIFDELGWAVQWDPGREREV